MITRQFAITGGVICARDGSKSTPIDIDSATLAMDAAWTPYAQATLECRPPATAAALTAIEPRSGLRCRFTVTQTNSDGSTFSRAHDLGLRTRSQDWTSGSMTLDAASDEALLQDYAYGTVQTWWQVNMPTSTIIDYVLRGAYTGGAGDAPPPGQGVLSVPLVVVAGAPTASVQWDTDQPWAAGMSAWDYCDGMAEAAGAWFYVDELAVPRYAPQGWASNSAQLTLDDASAIVTVQDTVSRDDPLWGTDAVVSYTGNSPTAIVYTYDGPTPTKAIVLSRPQRKPAGNAATRVATGARKRGRRLTVTALADIRARPNQPVTVTWMGQTRSGTLQSVAFDFPAGLMRLAVNVTES